MAYGGLGDGTKASADLQTAIGIDPSFARMVKINQGDAPTGERLGGERRGLQFRGAIEQPRKLGRCELCAGEKMSCHGPASLG